jgi:hypothetical protein
MFVVMVAVSFVLAEQPEVKEQPTKPRRATEQTVAWSDLNDRIAVTGRVGELGSVVTIRCRVRPAKSEGVAKQDPPVGFLEVYAVDGVNLASPVEFSNEEVYYMAPARGLDWRTSGEWELRGFESGGFGGIPCEAESPDVQSSGATFQFRTHFRYFSSRNLN